MIYNEFTFANIAYQKTKIIATKLEPGFYSKTSHSTKNKIYLVFISLDSKTYYPLWNKQDRQGKFINHNTKSYVYNKKTDGKHTRLFTPIKLEEIEAKAFFHG